MIKSYKDLNVWKEAMDLVTDIYKKTKAFPREEVYGLTSQMRRAAVSVPSNIAEGHQRHTTAQFLQFLSIARGSLGELETQIMIACRLEYINLNQQNDMLQQAQKVGNLMGGLIRSLKARS